MLGSVEGAVWNTGKEEGNAMKAIVMALGLVGVFSGLLGCSYAGLATSGDKVVVLRNGFASNTAYVCKVGDNGVSSCVEGESP